jgi:hypothetical protein
VIEDGGAEAGDAVEHEAPDAQESAKSVIGSEVGYPDAALEYFLAACGVDLDDGHGNTADGIHVASCVGHGWRSYVSELFDRLTPYVSEAESARARRPKSPGSDSAADRMRRRQDVSQGPALERADLPPGARSHGLVLEWLGSVRVMPSRGSARKLAPERPGRPRRGPPTSSRRLTGACSVGASREGGTASAGVGTGYRVKSRIGVPIPGDRSLLRLRGRSGI